MVGILCMLAWYVTVRSMLSNDTSWYDDYVLGRRGGTLG